MRNRWKGRFGALVVGAAIALNVCAQEAEKVVLDGSTGVMPLASALAKAFQVKFPGAAFEFGTGLGTGKRFQALAAGKIDIALASHGLRVEDLTKQGMIVHEIARIAVVFGVNETVPASNLTAQQVATSTRGKSRTGRPWVVPNSRLRRAPVPSPKSTLRSCAMV